MNLTNRLRYRSRELDFFEQLQRICLLNLRLEVMEYLLTLIIFLDIVLERELKIISDSDVISDF